jgi:O-antigen ligase
MTALRSRPATHDLTVAAGIAAVAALVGLAGLHWGPLVLLVPPALAGALVLLLRPELSVALLLSLVVMCERADTGLFPFTSHLYDDILGGPSAIEWLMAFSLVAVVLERLAKSKPVRIGGPLALPLALIALAGVAGAVTGHFAGASIKTIVFAGHQVAYVLVMPLLVVNVVDSERRARQALGLLAGLAVVKSALGLLTVAAGAGTVVDGATITYYEPVANWLALIVILGVAAALLARARPPLWLLAGTPLLVLSLALSLRRSFWIGAALGFLLVLLLGSRPLHRRLLLPAGVLVVVALWGLSAVGFQAFEPQGPIVERARSLDPSKVRTNAQDRYRLDERANVVDAIKSHPVAGLGLAVDWEATHPLGIEHENGRNYTHIVALWWWLKLGILGFLAYLSFMAASLLASWRTWRRSADPWLSAAGLAGFCGLAALIVVETVGSFTGVDVRFSVLIGAVAGLLAALQRVTAPAEP